MKNTLSPLEPDANWKLHLTAYLQELHLPAIRSSWEDAAHTAEQETLSYGQFLLEVTAKECQARRNNRIDRLRRESGLPLEKTLQCFDLKRLPQKAARQMKALLDGGFLDRKENILVFGKPGVGKTHLLCGIAQELIQSGRQMRFTTCSLLVQELLQAKRELRLSRCIKQLSRNDGLIIDEMGYFSNRAKKWRFCSRSWPSANERCSVLMTSNLAFSQWEGIFKDPMTTAAAIDRLVHHSVIIELNIRSYRMEEASKTKAQSGESIGAENPDKKEEAIP